MNESEEMQRFELWLQARGLEFDPVDVTCYSFACVNIRRMVAELEELDKEERTKGVHDSHGRRLRTFQIKSLYSLGMGALQRITGNNLRLIAEFEGYRELTKIMKKYNEKD